MVEYELSKPMRWDAFKKLPKYVQKEYVQNLISRFNVTSVGLAEMFGVTALTLRRYLASEHEIKFTRGKSMKPFEEIEWAEFIGSSPVENEQIDYEKDKTRLTSFTLEYSGLLDVNDVCNSLKMVLGEGSHGKIEIVCSLS